MPHGATQTVTPAIWAVRSHRSRLRAPPPTRLSWSGAFPVASVSFADCAGVAAGKRLDDDAHVAGHRVGADDPLGVEGLVDLALHVSGGGEGLAIGIENAGGRGQLARLGDQLVGVGGRALALPLALDLLQDPHAGDVEEGTHSPVGAALIGDAHVESDVAHEGPILDGTQDGPGAAGQEVSALAFLDGQTVDRAGRVVGTAAHAVRVRGRGPCMGRRRFGRQTARRTSARDVESSEDLVVEVAAAGGEQAGRRGDGARPANDTRQSVHEVVGQEEYPRDALSVGGIFLQVGEQLVRRVDGRRLVSRQIEEFAVADALTEGVQGAGGALVTVGDNVADEVAVLIKGSPVHSPRVN